MYNNLILFAYFCITYNLVFVSYLVYKEYFRAKPLSFFEVFMYIESVIERLEKTSIEDLEDVKKQILNSELRTQDKFRETIKQLKNDSREAKR